MLTFRFIESKNAIEVEFDNVGMAALLEELALLIHHRNHTHLRTPALGGSELSRKSEVSEVTIYYRRRSN
jgi:hypothetical protein